MLSKQIMNKKGFTLIELVVVMAIMGIVLTVLYSMLNFTYRVTNIEFKESNQRNDVRIASSFLKKDIIYAKSIVLTPPSKMVITDKNNNTITYSIKTNANGKNSLVRDSSGSNVFTEIEDAEFQELNSHLIKAKLITDKTNNKFTDFKIFKWGMSITMPSQEETINEAIVNGKVFVLGAEVKVDGSCRIEGTDATVIVTGGANYSGGSVQFIATKNIFINGDLTLTSGAGIGKTDNTSLIYIKGNCYIDGDSRLYGNTTMDGNFSVNSPRIQGNVYINKNVDFLGGSSSSYESIPAKLYYKGNMTKPDYFNALPNVIKVSSIQSIEFPNLTVPPLKDASWYASNGYTSNSSLRNNMKYYGPTMSFEDNGSPNYTNAIVASKGDINLTGNVHVTGVLFAPNGQVTVGGSSTFKGIIIARTTYITGNCVVTFETKGLTDLPF